MEPPPLPEPQLHAPDLAADAPVEYSQAIWDGFGGNLRPRHLPWKRTARYSSPDAHSRDGPHNRSLRFFASEATGKSSRTPPWVAPIESSRDSTSHLAENNSIRRQASFLRDPQTFGDLQYRRNRFTPSSGSVDGKMNRLCRPMESAEKNFFLTGHF